MKRFLFVSLALAVGIMAAERSAVAQLTPLPDNTTVIPGAFTETGTAIATVSGTFASPSGTFTETVYREAGGTLNFDFSVTNTSSTIIESVTTASFDSFTTSVGYTPGTGVIPTNAARADGILTFNFPGASSGQIPAGGSSDTLIVATNATLFTSGTISVQDGTASTGTPLAFAPTASPEPSTMVIAALGALGFVGYGLRRRKALGA